MWPPHLNRIVLLAAASVLVVLASLWRVPPPATGDGDGASFRAWLAAFADEAVDAGFDRRLVDSSLAGLEPLPRVLEADRTQAGVPTPLHDYLSARVTPELVLTGQDLMRRHSALLSRIERRYDVPAPYLVAIWGAETGYGRYTGDVPVLRALATLAWNPRRAAYFRGELFHALRMIERGYIERETMLGSWAGAMGQPQFMPSSYLEHAVDFDGDGRRDIWTSEADTLASIANYLQKYGWLPGVTWGREVELSTGAGGRVETIELRQEGCQAIRSLTERRALRSWTALGVRQVDGSPLPRTAVDASLLTLDGRAFLVSPSYEAILGYNCTHRYALSVAMLADAIR